MRARCRREPAVHLVQRAAGPYRGQRRCQRAAIGRGVVHVVGPHHVEAVVHGQLDKRVVAGGVQRVSVVPHLHDDVLPPEGLHQHGQLTGRRRRPFGGEDGGDGSLAAPGEDQPVTAVEAGQGLDGRLRPALLPARQLRLADGAAQKGIAVRVAGEHDQVTALRVGDAVLGPGQPQGELGAEDRPQPHRLGRLREADHAVHPVVVGEGQGGQAQAGRLLGQLLGVRGTVEEAEVGMAVKLGVWNRRLGRPRRSPGRRGLVGLALGRPGRTVTSVGVGRVVAGPAVGEAALQLRPRHLRIVEAHVRTLANVCSIR